MAPPDCVQAFAPAKVNLCLHVTGQRADGYHLLDSLVAFADVGDFVQLTQADELAFSVTGPEARGVPDGPENLCVAAALGFGHPARIELNKILPATSGMGGGSSDAAAVLRGLEQLSGRPLAFDASMLGADVPVCLLQSAARIRGIGDQITPCPLPKLYAVLVNPRVAVSTPKVFDALKEKEQQPLGDIPDFYSARALCRWLRDQRNDLETPAIEILPEIDSVLNALSLVAGQLCFRMSGSGATCFALFDSGGLAEIAAKELVAAHPDWWVWDCCLN